MRARFTVYLAAGAILLSPVAIPAAAQPIHSDSPPHVTVSITRGVKSPGIYSIRENSSLGELIRLAGGRRIDAANAVRIVRRAADGKRKGFVVADDKFILMAGDEIAVLLTR